MQANTQPTPWARPLGEGLGEGGKVSPDTRVPLELLEARQQLLGKRSPRGIPTGAEGETGRSSNSGGEPSSSAASTPRGGDSMAARAAARRQDRSMRRVAGSPIKGAAAAPEGSEDPAERVAQGELLSILRDEVTQSGNVIDGLQEQIRQKDQEMAEMGAHTTRMQTQLLELLEQLDGRAGGQMDGWSDSDPPGSQPEPLF